jgi:Protein of unknown function (DUF2865)
VSRERSSRVVQRAQPTAAYFSLIAALTFVIGSAVLALAKLASGTAVDGLLTANVDAPRASRSLVKVLGSIDALSDLVSGTYERKSARTAAAPPAKGKVIDGSRRSGLLKAVPPPRPASPFSMWFGAPSDAYGLLPPALPPLTKPKLSPVKPAVVPGYRTVCVRLCDGAFFPVSTATVPGMFERDEATCKTSCNSPAELYVYRTADGSPETMEDLEGRPYVRLTTAFQFRVAYDASCTCKPHPWQDASIALHRRYADQAPGKKPLGRRAELQMQSPGLARSVATEFLPESPRSEPRNVPRFAAATTDVMTDASLLPPVSNDMPRLVKTAPEPGVTTGPDTPVETVEPPVKVKPVRQTRPRSWSGRSGLGRGQDAASTRPGDAARRRSTASDDFMLNLRR